MAAKADIPNIVNDSTIQTHGAIDYFSLNSNKNDKYEAHSGSGTYKITESIVFDFNAAYDSASSHAPRRPTSGNSTSDNNISKDIYSGAGTFYYQQHNHNAIFLT